MPQLLSVSRAARLAGVTRGEIQKRIKDGILPTFEGMVKATDLLHVYPKIKLEDTRALERLNQIKDQAYLTRKREKLLPNAEVIAARLMTLTKAHAETRALLRHYQELINQLKEQFDGLTQKGNEAQRAVIEPIRSWMLDELSKGMDEVDLAELFIVKDNFLRLMTAHVKIQPSGHEFFVEGSDSILDAALRAGLALNYGCSNGNCGLCKGKIISGDTTKIRHHDYVLSEAEKTSGYTLLCSYTAVTDLIIEAVEAGSVDDIATQRISARVKQVTPLSSDTLLLHLQTPRTNRLRFLAGQYVRLTVNKTHQMDLPIASCPCDDRNLEFHIRVNSNDPFSSYVQKNIKTNETVEIEGPQGRFTLEDESPRSLIFLAYDTGFAPVKSLIEHAMSLENAERMHLYWYACDNDKPYLHNLCRSWTDALDNFRYITIGTSDLQKTNPSACAELIKSSLHRIADEYPNLDDFEVYVSGPSMLAKEAESTLLSRGLPKAQLHIGYQDLYGL
jgi:CDP-4-dehydro-6-deoxyglucose reductase, E3